MGQWNGVVTNPDSQSGTLENGFTITDPPPTVTGITPNTGVNTGTVDITDLSGTGFLNGAAVNLTRFGELNLTATGVIVQSPLNITCMFDLTGASAGQWNVVVTNPDGQEGMLENGFTITDPAPTVTGITPSIGFNTGPVSITNLAGANFNTTTMPTVNLTRPGETNLTATGVATPSATRITCTFDLTGAAAGQWNVVVMNPDGQSGMLENGFRVLDPTFCDIGLFRPSTRTFYLDWNGNGVWNGAVIDRAYPFGLTGDQPVSGEWNAVGTSCIGVFRNATRTFYLDWNGNGMWDGVSPDRAYTFGLTGDIPVSGDWNGIGRSCIGVFRPATHTFYLDWNGNGRWDGAGIDRAFDFGLTGDIPVSGDWNGIGRTCIGVFRPATHTFYLDWDGNGVWNGAGVDRAYDFGLTGDIPVSGDWGELGRTAIGVFRSSTHTFYLDYSGNGRWDGSVVDRAGNFGLTNDKPVAGVWG